MSQYTLVVGIRIRPGFHPRDRFADQTLDLGRRIVSIWGFDVHRGMGEAVVEEFSAASLL